VQLSLPFEGLTVGPPNRPPVWLERRLSSGLQQPVQLTITDNRRTMISARPHRDGMLVRLHRMFLHAGDEVVDALERYLGGRCTRRAAGRIDAFIAANIHQIRAGQRPLPKLRPRGIAHDLREIADDLNASCFGGEADVHVTWGRWSHRTRRRRRSIRLGLYVPEDRLVRVHPVLDQSWVPAYVVRFVVFHEMLHHVVPPPKRNGRHAYHCERFRARERAHPDYHSAVRWEADNLPRLLRESDGRKRRQPGEPR